MWILRNFILAILGGSAFVLLGLSYPIGFIVTLIFINQCCFLGGFADGYLRGGVRC